jgi:hypothetical protein
LIYESLPGRVRRPAVDLPAPMAFTSGGMPGFSANGLRTYPLLTPIPLGIRAVAERETRR